MLLDIFQSHFQTGIMFVFVFLSLDLLGVHMSSQEEKRRRVMVQDEMLSHQLEKSLCYE